MAAKNDLYCMRNTWAKVMGDFGEQETEQIDCYEVLGGES